MADQIGPRCGNNPKIQLTPGDRKALDDFRAFLEQRAVEADRSQPTVSEADAERLAALADCTDGSRVGLHCDHYQEGDGACCSCGRPNWCPDGGVVSSAGSVPAADRATVLREVEQHIRELARATFQPYYRSAYATLADDIGRMAAEAAARRMADETPPAEAEPTPDEPTVRATRYLVTCVPEHRDPGGYRGVTVEYRGDERWAILHYALCLGTDGRWARERQSSERDEEWLATHRFDLATARRLAEEQAKDLVRPAKDHRPAASAQPADETAERVVAYRSPGTRTLYCVTCARQETGWQPITGAEVRDDAVCDFCGGQCLGIASQTLGAVIARYDAEQPAKEA